MLARVLLAVQWDALADSLFCCSVLYELPQLGSLLVPTVWQLIGSCLSKLGKKFDKKLELMASCVESMVLPALAE